MIEYVPCANPEVVLDTLCQSGGGFAAVRYIFSQYYLAGNPDIELTGLFCVDGHGKRIIALVTDKVRAVELALADRRDVVSAGGESQLRDLADALETPVIELTLPLGLAPVHIPKPWGQEIWYTGIERRGQACVSDGRVCVPLPWVLSLAPRRLVAGNDQRLNLLKILDPLPDPVFGDLYFELHEEKREVYVVTHVNSRAWPDGVGAIRFGFDQQLRRTFATDAEFCDAYLAAVTAYEQVRRRIDRYLDQRRLDLGIGLADAVDVTTLKIWHGEVVAEDKALEEHLRMEMNRFTKLKPLRLGDVVKVPCLTPHALQHGVRTVEFQTPVYERRILSFAQKVLTQPCWDTPAAVVLMALDDPEDVSPDHIAADYGVGLERIAQFSDFDVQRLSLDPGAHWRWEATGNYALAMVVLGVVNIADQTLEPESAVLVPADRRALVVRNGGSDNAVLLISAPGCSR